MLRIEKNTNIYKKPVKFIIDSLNREIPRGKVDQWVSTVLSKQDVANATSEQINIFSLAAKYYKNNAPEIYKKMTEALKLSRFFNS